MKTNKVLNFLVILTSIVLVVFLIVLGVQVATGTNAKTQFQENVVINGVNVKGLTKLQAENKVNSALKNKIENIDVTLRYKDKEWKYNSSDFKTVTNIHTIVDDAFRYQLISKTGKDKLEQIKKVGVNYDLAFNKIFVDFKDKVEEIKSEIEIEPVDSEVEFLPDSKEIFKITKSQNGLKLNEDKLYSDIKNGVDKPGLVKVAQEASGFVGEYIEPVANDLAKKITG